MLLCRRSTKQLHQWNWSLGTICRRPKGIFVIKLTPSVGWTIGHLIECRKTLTIHASWCNSMNIERLVYCTMMWVGHLIEYAFSQYILIMYQFQSEISDDVQNVLHQSCYNHIYWNWLSCHVGYTLLGTSCSSFLTVIIIVIITFFVVIYPIYCSTLQLPQLALECL